MARDAELDRLGRQRDEAFKRKQAAWQKQNELWQRRSEAKELLSQAFERKDLAYQSQQRSWEDFQRVKQRNSPEISRLNSQQEAAYQEMKQAFERASDAHGQRDGAGARSYADEGHRYKAEAQDCVVRRRILVDEIKSARAQHEPNAQRFQLVKNEFDNAKQRYDSAKTDHDQAKIVFQQAKLECDEIEKSFQTRLGKLKQENQRQQQDRRTIARRAGVPSHYFDDMIVEEGDFGEYDIYFGGVGSPNGAGHGHYHLSGNRVTYKRDPFDPHGAENFVGVNGFYRGIPAKIKFSDVGGSDRIDIYFNGRGAPDGPGHDRIGVVKDSVRYWREGGIVYVDNIEGIQ